MKNSGQAAIEFITTYGWAFLVVFAVLGSLIYFGVADTVYYVPDSCYIEPPFSCLTSKVTSSGMIQLEVKNNFGREMAEANITISPLSCTIANIADSSHQEINLANGKNFNESNFGVLTFLCDAGTAPDIDERFEADITVQYRVRDQTTWHTLPGQLKARVER